jgi:hypothetical protein
MPKNKIINFLDKYQDVIIALFIIVILFSISLFINICAIFFNSNKYSIVERENQDLHYILSSSLSLLVTLILTYFYYRISKNNYKLFYSSAILLPLFFNIYILIIFFNLFCR